MNATGRTPGRRGLRRVPGVRRKRVSRARAANCDALSTHKMAADFVNAEVLQEDDRPVVPGLLVRAATLPALARLVVSAFDCDGEVSQESRAVPEVVFRTHRWFATSTELAGHLMSVPESAPCPSPGCGHSATDGGCPASRARASLCRAFRYWISNFPVHFNVDSSLANALRDFQSTLPAAEAALFDLSLVPSYDWMRHVSVRCGGGGGGGGGGSSSPPPQSDLVKSCRVSLVLHQLAPAQLAEHITYLEHKVIRRITFQDIRRYTESGSLRDAPKLERSVALFNGLTQWIQCTVLSRTTPQQRADVIAKFVAVAQRLLELQNYNSLMAVVGSVSHSALARLSRTAACVPHESKRQLAELAELLSASNNFGNYRRSLGDSAGFKIPILGIHLKDIISLHAALPDKLDGGMVNLRKMAQLSLMFKELEDLQNSAPPIEVNMDLVNTLRCSLDLSYTEDEIYELSLAREPRNSSSPQCSPTQSVLFAEWAAGPCPPPDPQTIEKHVDAMVEAVFNNYDNDRDGYISHDEFDAVATNFPFIASFCVLDADHDGMISQEEMKKYFIHANCHALKNGFKHDFHETTYFKPTFCAHCAGLLWGLIRQGYKCRDCGINAHKHCKDLVVMECRLRNNPPGDAGSHAATSRRRFKRKKKSSVSESESNPPSPKCSTSGGDPDGGATDQHSSDASPGGSLPPSPKPAVMWSTSSSSAAAAAPRRKISDSLLVPQPGRLRAQRSCPETCSHHRLKEEGLWCRHGQHPPLQHSQPAVCHPPLAHQAAIAGCGCHAEVEALSQKLAAAEEARQRLLKENQFLLQQLESAYKELHSLRDHVGEVRQQTVAFILGQMETLHIQKDTHV
ncbi:ras guanyl-releasing protein 3-like isoform X2 [Bacillus rossius redtenbacheri]|uniref:ras guanyl-releasing protein 3-like isoform X2 n=2 Tax=Bacillus rossius redtenbacheri TaxID=93214 RepID=UPI002FDDD4FB